MGVEVVNIILYFYEFRKSGGLLSFLSAITFSSLLLKLAASPDRGLGTLSLFFLTGGKFRNILLSLPFQ